MRAIVYHKATGRIMEIRDVPAAATEDELLEHVFGSAKGLYACKEDVASDILEVAGKKVQAGELVDDPSAGMTAGAIVARLNQEKAELMTEKAVLEEQLSSATATAPKGAQT